ncbi:hypothetical protein DPMN_058825 [Dreissena polymorpha]|uniref:Uncharacterized protein n=1 Tax=Dreissena polymorpha TaxID=45954 RepID=A0A9D4C2G3_DREPO|nr:hypothetical protein DPMN_058825 [Dreissena polymorpha]
MSQRAEQVPVRSAIDDSIQEYSPSIAYSKKAKFSISSRNTEGFTFCSTQFYPDGFC